MKQFCSAVIWLDVDHRTSSYCMRNHGHAGKCSIIPDKETAPVKCTDVMCGFATADVEHEHPDPSDLTIARVGINKESFRGVRGTN